MIFSEIRILFFGIARLLYDDFLEQNGGDVVGLDRGFDPAGQFLLEPVEAGGAVEIGRGNSRK